MGGSSLSAAEEQRRLRALHGYHLLDTAPEPTFENITSLCAKALGVPIVLISLLDKERQWFKSAYGTDVRETSREVAFCNHTICQDDVFLVSDLTLDERFRENPLVCSGPEVRFYAGVPLRTPEGHALGTLCALDVRPREFGEREIDLMARMARQVEIEFELRKQGRQLSRQLEEQRSGQQRMELFAAMAVHDLRNPATAIAMTAFGGSQGDAQEMREALAEVAEDARRIKELIASILDICMAENGGLALRPTQVHVNGLLQRATRCVQRAAQMERVTLEYQPHSGTLFGDAGLLHRALVNLLENGVQHSGAGATVSLRFERVRGSARLIVEDQGLGIPEPERAQIFEPFLTLDTTSDGRGLGLAYCRIVAEAHGGNIWVEENEPQGSRFVLELGEARDPRRRSLAG